MTPIVRISSLASLLLLGACVTVPTGPNVMVLPGTGKSFDQFRADEYDCRQYAAYQGGGMSASEAAADSGVKSAAVGTLVGAAAGAAINGGHGAAVGAGVGLLAGALAGTGARTRTTASGRPCQPRWAPPGIRRSSPCGQRYRITGLMTPYSTSTTILARM